MSNNLKPKIRFKGFTDTWEQRKLLDVAYYKNGKAHENDINENGKYIVVNSKFVSTDGKVRKYSNKQNEPLNKNDIAFVLSDVPNGKAIAKIFVVDKSGKYTLNQRIAGITPHYNINPKYLAITMNRNKYFLQFDDGVKQTNLSLNDMQKYENYYPTKREQDKLGYIFDNIDNLITLHQRKYDKLVDIKKALLEKMFPKNNSNIPEIRFKGFTDAWEQRKVSDIANRYDNLRVPVTAHLREKGSTPYYGANGIQDYVKGYTHKGEFILIAEDGANDLKDYPVQYVNGSIWANNHVHVLQGKGNIADNKFLKYSISQTNIEVLLVGGGRAKLNANIMMKMTIKLPKNITEQLAIGDYIYKLDNLITLHQRKHEKLVKIKQSLLRDMFV